LTGIGLKQTARTHRSERNSEASDDRDAKPMPAVEARRHRESPLRPLKPPNKKFCILDCRFWIAASVRGKNAADRKSQIQNRKSSAAPRADAGWIMSGPPREFLFTK
jgi:hypothetical protein